VSVARADLPLHRLPLAIHTIDRAAIGSARPTWGLDETLSQVPGIYAANRYNFSVDQRLSIRGFGARSAFAVRGIKVLVDGIPQTLPDGQGQITNLELGAADRIEVLRGASSALFGNAAGGVISIWTDQAVPTHLSGEARVVAGAFDRSLRRAWTKWQATTRAPVGDGVASVTVSRLAYEGERDHSAADLRTLNARLRLPVAPAWTVAVALAAADHPRADNPGALTLAELQANRDSAAPLNIGRIAGKDVRQLQGGATLKSAWGALTVFGLTRDLTNPLPQAYITIDRGAGGVRMTATPPFASGAGHPAIRLTAGVDLQWQRDNRREFSYQVPNAALTTPDNSPDTLVRSQIERVAELGPFLQAGVDLGPRWTATAGLRYDRVRFAVTDRLLSDGVDNSGSRTFAAASGSIGVAYSTGPGFTLYANSGSSFETPTTTELNNQPPPGGGGFNPDLAPQRAWSSEVGGRGTTRDGRLGWNVAVFQANVRDELIGFEDSLVPGRRYFRNAARARHSGVEAGATFDVTARVRLALTWTYADYRFTSYRVASYDLSGKAIPGVPRHWVHLSARAHPAFLPGAWGELETTHSSGTFVDDTLTTRVAPWWTANVRVGWKGLFVGVNNVLDQEYIGSVVINAARGRYYEPAAGRNLYAGWALQTRE
jgi:iron complex outermembrane recepter protein